jgi:hypothetical protein
MRRLYLTVESATMAKRCRSTFKVKNRNSTVNVTLFLTSQKNRGSIAPPSHGVVNAVVRSMIAGVKRCSRFTLPFPLNGSSPPAINLARVISAGRKAIQGNTVVFVFLSSISCI